LQGIISAILSILILYKIYFVVIEKIHQTTPFLPVIWDKKELVFIGLVLIALGSLVGFLGSMFSVGKYISE